MKDEHQNQTIYIRESHGESYTYTVVSNSLINDTRLNVTEIGLMTKFLSKGNNYVFHSTYELKASGIGQVTFNNCMKKLKDLGYIIRKPLLTGGYKWILIESKEIISDLQTIGYLQWDYTKKCWIVDESKFTAFQLTDFHRIVDIQKAEFQKAEFQKAEFQKAEFQKAEINSLLSTNTPSTKEPIKDEKNKNEENKNEHHIREKIFEDDNFEDIEISKPDLVDLDKVVKEENIITTHKNDYELVYNSSDHFKAIVRQNPNWSNESIKNHSNAFIAMNTFNYNCAKEKEQEEMLRKDKLLSFQIYITKFACRLSESELRKEYERECTINDKLDLMYK